LVQVLFSPLRIQGKNSRPLESEVRDREGEKRKRQSNIFLLMVKDHIKLRQRLIKKIEDQTTFVAGLVQSASKERTAAVTERSKRERESERRGRERSGAGFALSVGASLSPPSSVLHRFHRIIKLRLPQLLSSIF
jgi:hypothetical protein